MAPKRSGQAENRCRGARRGGRRLAILKEADYGIEHVVRVGVWLDDPRDFWSFNKILSGIFRSSSAGACMRAVFDDG